MADQGIVSSSRSLRTDPALSARSTPRFRRLYSASAQYELRTYAPPDMSRACSHVVSNRSSPRASTMRGSSSWPVRARLARRRSSPRSPGRRASIRCAIVTLDDRATREAADDDPAGFVAGLGGPAVIDEIQHVPELLLELKRAVDADAIPGRFLITGSADVLAHRKVIDALPGRIDRIESVAAARDRDRGRRAQRRRRVARRVAHRRSHSARRTRRLRQRDLRGRLSRKHDDGPPGGYATAGSATTSPEPSARTCSSSPTCAAPTRPTDCCG